MKNRIIRNVDSILLFVLKLVMFFVWMISTYISLAFLKMARNASNVCTKSHLRMGKDRDRYESAKEDVNCVNRMFQDDYGVKFSEILTEMFKVEA